MAETYTLDEAKRELQRRECARFGHSWEFLMVVSSDVPTGLVCACGRRCRVEEDA